MNIKQQI